MKPEINKIKQSQYRNIQKTTVKLKMETKVFERIPLTKKNWKNKPLVNKLIIFPQIISNFPNSIENRVQLFWIEITGRIPTKLKVPKTKSKPVFRIFLLPVPYYYQYNTWTCSVYKYNTWIRLNPFRILLSSSVPESICKNKKLFTNNRCIYNQQIGCD